MKINIIFDSEVEDDMIKYKDAYEASNMRSFIWEFSQYLREQRKYVEPDKQDNVEIVEEKFFEILQKNNLQND